MSHELSNIKVAEIAPPRVMLALVDKESLDYLELKHSIRDDGILQSLTVRATDGKYKYQLVNGVKRFSVAQDLHLETVPCILMGEMSTSDVIVKQIQENCCRHKLQPMELSLHFKRLLLLQPDLTFADLAMMVHKSPVWVKQVLKLQDLVPIAKKMMDTQVISMTSAVVLAKLPQTVQTDLVDSALDMPPKEFMEECRRVRKAFRKAHSEGRLLDRERIPDELPNPRLRPLREIRTEHNSHIYGENLIRKNPDMTPSEIWKEAMAWVLRMDVESIKQHQDEVRKREGKKLARLDRYIKNRAKIAREKKLNIDIDSDWQRLGNAFLL